MPEKPNIPSRPCIKDLVHGRQPIRKANRRCLCVTSGFSKDIGGNLKGASENEIAEIGRKARDRGDEHVIADECTLDRARK